MTDKLADTTPSNVRQLIDPRYRELLDEASRENSFSVLLEAISLIAGETINDDSAVRTWSEMEISEPAEDIPGIVLRWLATLDFSISQQLEEPSPAAPPEDDVAANAARKLGAGLSEVSATQSKQARDLMASQEMEPYRGFHGAVPVIDFLSDPGFQPVSEAARLIAQYIGHLFSPDAVETGRRIMVQQRWLRGFIDTELLPWTREKAEQARADGHHVHYCTISSCKAFPFLTALLAGEIMLSNPDSFPEGFSAGLLPDLMLHVPQELFDVLVEVISADIPELETEDQEEPYLELFDLMTALPLEHRPLRIETCKRQVPRDSIVHDALELYGSAREIPFVRCSQLAWFTLPYGMGWNISVQDLARGRNSRVGDQLWTSQRLGARLCRLNREITAYRSRNLGRLPIDMAQAADLAASLYVMAQDIELDIEFDLALLLASTDEPLAIGYEAGISSPVLPVSAREAGYEPLLQERSDLFRQACICARNEGFHDLSDALTAFYLFTQSLCDPHRDSIDWGWIGDSLKDISARPCDHFLVGAAQIALEIAHEADGLKDFDQRRLSYFLGSKARASRGGEDRSERVLVDWLVFQRKNADRYLEEELGKDLKGRFSQAFWEDLAEAEHDFHQRKARAGRDPDQVDFSPVVLAYFKVIEKLFKDTFEFVSDHPRFMELVGLESLDRELAIADVIRVFRRFGSLPEEAKMHLRKKRCRLGSSGYSLEWLGEFRRLRNQAAHERRVGMAEAGRFRAVLYDKGLRMLADAIPAEVLAPNQD